MSIVVVNGKTSECISVKDRGFNYGDGLFETIALVNRKLHFWAEHYQRLVLGCKTLAIDTPDEAALLQDIQKLAYDESPAVIKIVISRGQGGRGYSAAGCSRPTIVVSFNPWPTGLERLQQGISVHLCQHPLVINPVLAGIKHLNRLDQIIARNEWQDHQHHEGLMSDLQQNLVEGVSSNLFAVQNSTLITAPVSACAVAGIVRQAVIRWAEELQINVIERKISLPELAQLDELFVCNSIWGILPITDIRSTIAETKRYITGPITQRMQQLFAQSRESDALNI